jgi:hypothetical protein
MRKVTYLNIIYPYTFYLIKLKIQILFKHVEVLICIISDFQEV